MEYRKEMLRHLKEAERLAFEIDQWEQWAEKKVDPKLRQKNYDLFLVRMKQLVGDKATYKNLTIKRDLHRNMAQMYGIAAIVEREYGQTHTEPGP